MTPASGKRTGHRLLHLRTLRFAFYKMVAQLGIKTTLMTYEDGTVLLTTRASSRADGLSGIGWRW